MNFKTYQDKSLHTTFFSRSPSPSPSSSVSPRRKEHRHHQKRNYSRSSTKSNTGSPAPTPPRTTTTLTKPSANTTSLKPSSKNTSERDKLLSNWRRNYCATREEVSTKIEELSKINQDDVLEKEKHIWTRSTPADLYYARDEENPKIINATPRLLQLCDAFLENLVLRAKKVNELKPKYVPPPRKNRARVCKHKSKLMFF